MFMANAPKDQDQLTEAETAKRRDAALKRALATKPKPHKAKAKMLTPSEIESLRQDGKETSDFARKAFAHLRPERSRKSPVKQKTKEKAPAK